MKMARAIGVRLFVVMTLGVLYAVPLAAQDAYAPLPTAADIVPPAPTTVDTLKTVPTLTDAELARARLFVSPASFRLPGTPEAAPIVPGVADGDAAAEPPQDDEFCCDSRHLGLTMIEIGVVLIAPWYFNRHVSDDSTAAITWDAYKRNIVQGFEWDADNFNTNMFGHPFGGALYFNAATSNGYNFWQASVFTWMGSFIWEMFGEANRPAINDWAATTLGGIGLGESFNRTSRMVWNNSATGFGRTLRELGGFALNPTGGASRLFRGEWTKVGKNPDGRIPIASNGMMQLGARHTGKVGTNEPKTSGYYGFWWVYGNPFEISDEQKPYDAFSLSFQLNSNTSKSRLGRLQTQGTLWGKTLRQSEKSTQVFHFTQFFDYINNEEVETGGSSLALSFMSRWKLSDTWTLTARAEPSALLIWGIDSEYSTFTGRSYDMGSGAGARLWGGLRYKGQDIVDVGYLFFWQHTLNGAIGDHLLSFVGVRGQYPIIGDFGLGATYFLTIQDSYYRDFPDVFRRFPEGRLYATYFFRGPASAP